MNETLKQLLRSKMVPAFMSIAVGIAVLIARKAALDVMVKIIGGLMIAGAVGFFGMYFFGPYRDSTGLLGGALSAVIGVLLIIYAPAVVDFFPTLMGIVLILNGLSNLTQAAVGGENRVLIGLLGILIIALGVLILVRPGPMANAIIIYIGISMIVNGLFDLILLYKIKDSIR